MSTAFAQALIERIMEGTMIPKVQTEREVGPILDLFLEGLLTEAFREDPQLSGPIATVCREFPFKKPDSRQSTNIDWLMRNAEREQLIFVELKTADTSFDLCRLDASSRATRNEATRTAAETGVVNFAGRVDFDSIVRICDESGDDVVVGFDGGTKALASRDLSALQARLFKWDNACGGSGRKGSGNWIPGAEFLRTIDDLRARSLRRRHPHPLHEHRAGRGR